MPRSSRLAFCRSGVKHARPVVVGRFSSCRSRCWIIRALSRRGLQRRWVGGLSSAPGLTGFVSSKFDPFLNHLFAEATVTPRRVADALDGRPAFVWLAETPGVARTRDSRGRGLKFVEMRGMNAATAEPLAATHDRPRDRRGAHADRASRVACDLLRGIRCRQGRPPGLAGRSRRPWPSRRQHPIASVGSPRRLTCSYGQRLLRTTRRWPLLLHHPRAECAAGASRRHS